MTQANPIYIGDLVQGRRRVKSYKVHQIEAVLEDEWVRVPDTHEAIITHETFNRVRELLKRDTRTAPKKREIRHPEPEREESILFLLHLQETLPDSLLHALYQAENGNIRIHFKFADEFRRIAGYIEINTTDTAETGCPLPKHKVWAL